MPSGKAYRVACKPGVAGYNEGIKAAKGQYVLLVDNDMDFCKPIRCKKLFLIFRPIHGSVL
jgi:hypothetical protein